MKLYILLINSQKAERTINHLSIKSILYLKIIKKKYMIKKLRLKAIYLGKKFDLIGNILKQSKIEILKNSFSNHFIFYNYLKKQFTNLSF